MTDDMIPVPRELIERVHQTHIGRDFEQADAALPALVALLPAQPAPRLRVVDIDNMPLTHGDADLESLPDPMTVIEKADLAGVLQNRLLFGRELAPAQTDAIADVALEVVGGAVRAEYSDFDVEVRVIPKEAERA